MQYLTCTVWSVDFGRNVPSDAAVAKLGRFEMVSLRRVLMCLRQPVYIAR